MKPRRTRRSAPPDHRTRVGRERRARTRARILEAAVRVFGEMGPDAPVIDDFIRAAAIARGTFYNYYRSTRQLLEDVSTWLEDELMESIEAEIPGVEHPVERVAMGMRLWMRAAMDHPEWCAFTVKVPRRPGRVERILGGDLMGGLKAGAFSFTSPQVAHDLVVGTIREAMKRITEERVPRTYGEEVAAAVLHGLCLDRRRIDKLMKVRLPAMARPLRSLG